MKNKRFLLRSLLITAGGLLVIDSLFVLTRSTPNLGTLLPMILGAPLVLCGLLLPWLTKLFKKSRLIKALSITAAAFYALMAIVFGVCFCLIQGAASEPEYKADALIVLGGGIRGNVPTLTLRYRLEKAAEYLKANPDCICIVSGGKGSDEQFSEAEVMRGWLISEGVEKERIIAEDRSSSTKENFEFSHSIIEERVGRGARTVFVTTRFHVFRSERVAAKLGIEAEGIPAKGVWYISFNDYLRESIAITAYWLSGKI